MESDCRVIYGVVILKKSTFYFFEPLARYKLTRRYGTFRDLEAYRTIRKPCLPKIRHKDSIFENFESKPISRPFDVYRELDPSESDFDP